MELKVHESIEGRGKTRKSARQALASETYFDTTAMWDSHFRVDGAVATGVQLPDCPVGVSSVKTGSVAASILMYMTNQFLKVL